MGNSGGVKGHGDAVRGHHPNPPRNNAHQAQDYNARYLQEQQRQEAARRAAEARKK